MPRAIPRVRELIGLKGDVLFEHAYLSKDPAVLVRHGHEYDGNNSDLQTCLAEDAVTCEPVSSENSHQQGSLQGILAVECF